MIKHLRSTLAIDPAQYSAKVSENRVASFGYAVAGCLHMLRYAPNLRIQAVATLLVVGLGAWLGLSALAWAVIVLTIGLNWFAEFMNAALEAAVNLASPEHHPMAQLAKDIAAGAVLVTTLMALLIAALLLLPPFWERLS